MLYTFELYEGHAFVGTKTVEAASELEATIELDSILAELAESHLEYDLLEDDKSEKIDEEAQWRREMEIGIDEAIGRICIPIPKRGDTQSLAQVCAEIEEREKVEDEQFMRELDAQMIVKERHTSGEVAYSHVGCFAEAMGMSEREVLDIGDNERRYGKFLISLVPSNNEKCIYCSKEVL